MTTGVYALILRNCSNQQIAIGSLGLVLFSEGFYVYIGSAMGEGSTSIERRVRRHFSKSKKKHWHIDYLLEHVELCDVLWAESDVNMECRLVHEIVNMKKFEYGPKSFGNSDCRHSCKAHILRYNDNRSPIDDLMTAFYNLNLYHQDSKQLGLRND